MAVGKSDFITFANVGTQEPPKILRNTNDRSGWIYWSPDRKWISYFNEQNIVLISPDGKAKKEVPNPGGLCHLMSWSKDGLSIYAVSSNSGIICTYQIDVNSGTSRKIGECKSNLNIGTDKKHTLFGCLTPDGKSIVTTAEQYKSDIWVMEGFPKP